ncbi:MAG: trigger factor [Candidatus Aminicenantes bacterium]|nr:trigger factor [Candidatus Aminicenantes bacterium]
MKSYIKEISSCRREIEVVIPEETVTREFDGIVKNYVNRAKIPGFRKGKVPVDLVKRRFYSDIKETFLNSVLPDALKKELRDLNLHPVGNPVIQELDFEEKKDLRFTAVFDVLPELKLPEIKKIKVKKDLKTVEDEDIEKAMENFRQQKADYIPIQGRGVKDGDYVVVELQGMEKEGGKKLPKEKVVVLAGHPENEKELNENILNKKEGEETRFTLTFPAGHTNKKLAGKRVDYVLKVISIKEKKVPTLDDEFAKEVEGCETVDDLKNKVKEELKLSYEAEAKNRATEKVLEKIAEKVHIDLPEALVQQETVAVLKKVLSENPKKELTDEEAKKLRDEAKQSAERNIVNQLILEKIAVNEKLSVTEADVDAELKSIAQAHNVPLPQVMENARKEGRKEELKRSLLMKKTIDFLVQSAIIE